MGGFLLLLYWMTQSEAEPGTFSPAWAYQANTYFGTD